MPLIELFRNMYSWPGKAIKCLLVVSIKKKKKLINKKKSNKDITKALQKS